MCGRYASFLPAEALVRVFGTTGPLPNLEPTWNMAPTKDAPIVRFDPDTGERRLEVPKWGLVPFFTKDLAKARKPINARCETVARSPLFKEAFARRRCLVPAAAYYEWRHDPSGKTRSPLPAETESRLRLVACGRNGDRMGRHSAPSPR